mgnify:FL=1
MKADFCGKTAVVVGNNSACRATALALAREGAKVFICGEHPIEPEAAACMQAQKIHMAQLRPADDQALLAFIAAAWEQTGAIHILVCDGRVAPVYKPLTEVTPEEWSGAIASTLRMNWKAVTAALPYMEGAELPAIVLITDPAVYHAGPLDGVVDVRQAWNP